MTHDSGAPHDSYAGETHTPLTPKEPIVNLKSRITTCSLGFALAFTTFSASAVTYYVDYASGSDSSVGTSPSSPWKRAPGDSSATGNAATATPAPGDTICFKGGVTYSSGARITLKSSGTATSKISYDGNCSGFGNGTKAIFTSNSNFYIRSRDYITIRNMEFKGFTNPVIWHDYSYYPDDAIGILVDSNYIHDGSIPQTGAVEFWNFQDVTLSNNTFYNVNYNPSAGGRGPTYFQCRFSGSSCVGDSKRLTITKNTFSYNGNTPVFCFGQSNLTISYNTIKGPNRDQHSQMITHYYPNEGGDAEIFGNYIDAERAGISFEGIHPTKTGVNIYNNIINSRNNVGWNITSWGPGATGTVRIINNTLLGTTGNESVGFGSDTYDMFIFRNNIAHGLPSPSTKSKLISNNCYTHTGSGSETGAVYNTNLSAIFRSTAFDSPDDYDLLSSSPCKDRGVDASVYKVSIDFAERVRPVNGAYDMGAYEYGGASSMTLSAPTNLRIVQ